MNEANAPLFQPTWRMINQTSLRLQFGALQSFAMDDTLCASVGGGHSPATSRAWIHDQTIVLGIQDTKLSNLHSGLRYLEQQGYTTIVRNSGGLAVVLDKEVLNLTLVFPEKKLDIKQGYEAMWLIIQQMFCNFPIKINAYQIEGSYCPGSYDLSIGGKKFAGISQRRIQKGVAVQCYLCVGGSGTKRAALIKEFYSQASIDNQSKFTPPSINSEVMASLSELLGYKLSINDVLERFQQALKSNSHKFYPASLSEFERHLYSHYYERIAQRNEYMLEK